MNTKPTGLLAAAIDLLEAPATVAESTPAELAQLIADGRRFQKLMRTATACKQKFGQRNQITQLTLTFKVGSVASTGYGMVLRAMIDNDFTPLEMP